MQLSQAWRRRSHPVAIPLLLFSISLGIAAIISIIDYLLDNNLDRLFVLHINMISSLSIQSIWIWILVEFVEDRVDRRFYFFLVEPIIMVIVYATNDIHHLFYTDVDTVGMGQLAQPIIDFGPIRIIHAIYILALWLGCPIWIIFYRFDKSRFHKTHFTILMFVTLLVLVQFGLTRIGWLPYRLGPLMSLIVLIWAIRYYRLLDLLPIARRLIIDNLESGIAILNKDDLIVHHNSAFASLMAMTIPLQDPFMHVSELSGSDNLIDIDNASISYKGNITTDHKKELEYKLLPILKNQQTVGRTMVLRDITEQTQVAQQKEYYTQQLQVSKRELEKLDKMKSTFFSNVTHEFRTPLTLIMEPARMLSDYPDLKVRTSANLITRNSNKLLQLVNQLLSLSKLESGQMELNLVTGDLTEVIREEFQKYLPYAEQQKVQIKLIIEPNIPLIKFDKQKIESIIANLLSNALKFTEKGMVTLTMGVISHKDRETKEYYIDVTDTGSGISKEHIDHIFERFYQVDSSDTRQGEGSGIGLALTAQLVKLIGGTISVKSVLGQGASFLVTLPLLSGLSTSGQSEIIILNKTLKTPATIPNETERANVSEASQSPENIDDDKKIALVVEDNKELRHLLKHGLESQSLSLSYSQSQFEFQVVDVPDGAVGITKALELYPDIIISDIMMPHKDGITMLQELKSNPLTSHIPVILLTAKSEVEDRLKGLSIGADDYMTKPFRMDELVIRSQNLIENRIRAVQKYIDSFQPDFIEKTPTTPDNEFLKRLMLIIESELSNEHMQIDDYAAKMLMSRTHLHRKIKSLTNLSTSIFIRNYRLDKARAMFINKEGTVFEIASKVGFSNEKYFSTSFKNRFGKSPSNI